MDRVLGSLFTLAAAATIAVVRSRSTRRPTCTSGRLSTARSPRARRSTRWPPLLSAALGRRRVAGPRRGDGRELAARLGEALPARPLARADRVPPCAAVHGDPDPHARAHAKSKLQYLAQTFPTTPQGHLARLRLHQGFPPLHDESPVAPTPSPYGPGSPVPGAAGSAARRPPALPRHPRRARPRQRRR